jgi:hypothetical protein
MLYADTLGLRESKMHTNVFFSCPPYPFPKTFPIRKRLHTLATVAIRDRALNVNKHPNTTLKVEAPARHSQTPTNLSPSLSEANRFEPTIPASERLQAHSLDRAVSAIG